MRNLFLSAMISVLFSGSAFATVLQCKMVDPANKQLVTVEKIGEHVSIVSKTSEKTEPISIPMALIKQQSTRTMDVYENKAANLGLKIVHSDQQLLGAQILQNGIPAAGCQ